MRLSLVLVVCSLLGIVGGAALISLAAVGGAIIFDSLLVGAWAVMRETGEGNAAPAVQSIPTLQQVLDRARAAS